MEKSKKVNVKKDIVKDVTPAMRQIIIETDGSNIKIAKAEVSGNIEFVAILQSLIGFLSKNK
jgi:hypothetical protein